MRMSIRFSATAAMLAVVFGLALTRAQAAEVQLAGVRLNDSVMNLLSRSGWGIPDAIGPLAQAGGTTASSANQGASGVSGQGGGSRQLPPALRAKLGVQTENVVASPAQPTAAQGQKPAAPQRTSELRGTGGMQYWLYSKSGGGKIILAVEPSGNIANITAQGPPNNQIRTSRGIGLGSSYFDLINFYGYPEVSQPIPSGLRVVYSDQDVIFILQNLRVTEITVGRPPAVSTSANSRRPTGMPPGMMLPGRQQ
jgi:hypothetical protein